MKKQNLVLDLLMVFLKLLDFILQKIIVMRTVYLRAMVSCLITNPLDVVKTLSQ